MKKIAADLVIQMIEFFERLAVEKAALGLGNLFGQGPGGLLSSLGSALTGGGAAAAAAAATTANTTALATLTAAITALTGATTAQAATSGAGAAAGAGGLFSGLGDLVHLFGFAEGTPYVQGTGLALLHAGEMVTPADLNPNNPRNSLSFAGGQRGLGEQRRRRHAQPPQPLWRRPRPQHWRRTRPGQCRQGARQGGTQRGSHRPQGFQAMSASSIEQLEVLWARLGSRLRTLLELDGATAEAIDLILADLRPRVIEMELRAATAGAGAGLIQLLRLERELYEARFGVSVATPEQQAEWAAATPAARGGDSAVRKNPALQTPR